MVENDAKMPEVKLMTESVSVERGLKGLNDSFFLYSS
jgi:hypothetical protein